MIVICVLLTEIKNEEEEDDQFTIKDNLDVRKSYVNKLLLEIRRACMTVAREGFTVSLIRKLAEEENKPKLNQTTTTKKTPNPSFSEECIYRGGNM